jgi:hypothetical protein
MYRSILSKSLTSGGGGGGGGYYHSQADLSPGKEPSTLGIEGWMDPRSGLDIVTKGI